MTTNRLPRTAPEILQRAADLGHVMALDVRGPWPEHGDPHPKYFLTCTCGFVGKAQRSEKAAKQTVAWHLGKAIGQAHDTTNGQEAARPPVRAAARREDVRPTPAGAEYA